MTAPRSIELEQHILVVIHDDLLVVTTDNDGDRALLGLGDGLRLDARLDLAINDILDELANLLGIDLLGLVVRVLGILGGLLDSEGRELLRLQVKVTRVRAEQLGVEGDNVDIAAVLLSDGAEVLGELLALLGSLGEDVRQWDTGLQTSERKLAWKGRALIAHVTYRHVLGVGLRAKLANQGSAGSLHKLQERLVLKLAIVDSLLLVKVLVKDNGGLLRTLGLGDGGVVGGTEKEVVALGFGEGSETLVGGLVIGANVADDHDLVHGLEFLQVLFGDGRDGGH